VNESDKMPLPAYMVLASGKNSFWLTGGPYRMRLAFSDAYLTWTGLYGFGGDEGAVAWDEVTEISIRKGRRMFAPAELAFVHSSGKEIVVDTMFPVDTWNALRKGAVCIGSERLLNLLESKPSAFEVMLPLSLLIILAPALPFIASLILRPQWFLVAWAVLGVVSITYAVVSLFGKREVPAYPRINDI
jgi:hypothetical protein